MNLTMAEGRLRLVGVPPCGPGLGKAVARWIAEGTVLTALDDAKLQAVRRMLPEDCDVEVAPLGDLVGRFLTMLGEPIARLIPRGQLEATVDLVAKNLSSDSPLATSARFKGTSALIVDRLGEIRDWNLTADLLRTVIEDAQRSLASKLESLVQIDESVRRILEETNRQFASDRAARCLEIPPQATLPIRRVLAAVGDAEKPLYEEWLRWITGFGIEVVVLVDTVKGADHLFGGTRRCADRLGTSVEVDKSASSWTAALFSDVVAKEHPEVHVVSTADPLSEAEWAVRGCIERTADGVLPHRLGIFARDSETYAPLLISSAARLGLPLSASVSTPLLTNGFAALTLQTLQVLAGKDVRAIGRLAQSSYLRTGLKQNDELLAALRAAFATKDRQWSEIADWAKQQGPDFEWLRHVLDWREHALTTRSSLSGWLQRLRDLVGGTQMIDFAADPDARTRQRDVNAQTVLQRSISDIAYVYDREGRPELGLEGFVRHAAGVWENETVVVAGPMHGVRLVTSTSSLTEFDTLFVVGMLEGTLPRRRSEDPILFDDDRAEIARVLGKRYDLPNSRDRAARERDEFVRICCAASTRLVFSYPQTDDQRDNVKAFYLDAIARACSRPVKQVTRHRSEIVPLTGECRAEADVAIRRSLDIEKVGFDEPSLKVPLSRSAVQPVLEDGVSPEELARALVCPFQSTFRYRLDVRPPARRRLMRSLRDLPALARLVMNGDKQAAADALERVIDDYLDQMYPEFEAWELAMLSAAARRLAGEWVDREFRSRDLWTEEGEQTWTDVSLDEHGLRNEIPIGGTKVRLKGRVPSLTQRRAFTVMRFFDSGAPNLTEITEVPEDNEDAFLYGLYLMTQMHLPPRNPAVEVDGMDGRRVLAGFKDIRASLKKDPIGGLEVVRISDSRDVFFQNVKRRLRESIDVLSAGEMRATPGDHCEPCPYGEICRVSKVFGEVQEEPREEDS